MLVRIIIVIAIFAVLAALVVGGGFEKLKSRTRMGKGFVIQKPDTAQTLKEVEAHSEDDSICADVMPCEGNGSIDSDGVPCEKIAKTYLRAAKQRGAVVYEVCYLSGRIEEEVVGIHTPRYEELKGYEPKRTHLSGGWGNNIDIVYEDGRSLTCECAWLSWEAFQLREELLHQGS